MSRCVRTLIYINILNWRLCKFMFQTWFLTMVPNCSIQPTHVDGFTVCLQWLWQMNCGRWSTHRLEWRSPSQSALADYTMSMIRSIRTRQCSRCMESAWLDPCNSLKHSVYLKLCQDLLNDWYSKKNRFPVPDAKCSLIIIIKP